MTDHTFIEKIDSHALQLIIDNFDELYDSKKLGRFVDAKKDYTEIRDKKAIKKLITEYLYRRTISLQQPYQFSKGSDCGRLFSINICLQGISRVIRHTISKNIYWDIDIVNAHPKFIHQYCLDNNIPVPALENYINNRDAILKDLMSLEYEDGSHLSRDEAKAIPLAILNGGDRSKLFETNSLPEFVSSFENEVQVIFNHFKETEKGKKFYKKALRKKSYNTLGTMLNYYLLEQENNVLQVILSVLKQQGRTVGVLTFDGCMVYKLKDELEFPQDILDCLERDVKAICGCDLQIVSKPMKEMIDLSGYSLKEDEKEDEKFIFQNYEKSKIELEKTHFKLINETLYCEELGDNVLLRRSEGKLKEAYRNKYYCDSAGDARPLIVAWQADPNIKTYRNVGVFPEGCSKDTYNLWKGFRAESFPTDGNCRSFINLVQRLCNYEKPVYEYLFKLLAQMIQFPHIKSDISTIIRSVQGGGKDTLFQIMNAVIGSKYCFNTVDVERDVFSRFNTAIEHKILIALNECSVIQSGQHSQKFKDFITCKTDKIEEKGFNLRESRSMTRYFVFINPEFNPKIEQTDRRFFVIDCIQPKLTLEESTLIYNDISNDSCVGAFYKYLMSINIKDFNFMANRPSSQYQEDLKEASLPIEFLFLRNYANSIDKKEGMLSKDLFTLFLEFKSTFGYKSDFSYTLSTFSLKIGNYSRDENSGVVRPGSQGQLRTLSGNGKGYRFDFDKMKKFFKADADDESNPLLIPLLQTDSVVDLL